MNFHFDLEEEMEKLAQLVADRADQIRAERLQARGAFQQVAGRTPSAKVIAFPARRVVRIPPQHQNRR